MTQQKRNQKQMWVDNDQATRIEKIAAERGHARGKPVSAGKILREVIEAGLRKLETEK